MDQIVTDFDQSGFPSLSMFSEVPSPAVYAYGPVSWSPGYTTNPPTPCQVGTAGGGTCTTPGDFDLIVETSIGGVVSWIRYELDGTTLYRAVVPKVAGVDPLAATSASGTLVPFIVNVMNNPPADQLAEIMATYPSHVSGREDPCLSFSSPVIQQRELLRARGCRSRLIHQNSRCGHYPDRENDATQPANSEMEAGGAEWQRTPFESG